MNPMQWLLIAAPATVIAAILFIGVFERVDNTAEVQREKAQLQQMEFDQDFASAWNGEAISSPSENEIEAQRTKVKELQAIALKAREQQKEKLAELADQLQTEVQSGRDITEDLKRLRSELNNEEVQNEQG
jgi:Na+/phosphate symporter